jgi:hypothetical protein
MKPAWLILRWAAVAILLFPLGAAAMGLRSFVAVPVDKGGAVVRLQLERNDDARTSVAIANLAWGLSARQTLLFGLPYRLEPSGPKPLGDLAVLYRHIVWQDDRHEGTSRLGLLGGAILPTDSDRDGAMQAGFVTTFYQGRVEWDVDLLYQAGLGARPDGGRYDVSRQFRLTPAEYPDWGEIAEWDLVTELNGRWREGSEVVHQATLGLQWVHQRWVLEGGVTQDLNGPEATRFLVSTRFHF